MVKYYSSHQIVIERPERQHFEEWMRKPVTEEQKTRFQKRILSVYGTRQIAKECLGIEIPENLKHRGSYSRRGTDVYKLENLEIVKYLF